VNFSHLSDGHSGEPALDPATAEIDVRLDGLGLERDEAAAPLRAPAGKKSPETTVIKTGIHLHPAGDDNQ
jgi:hypothetical protein